MKADVVKTNADLLGFRSCQELNLIIVILAVDTVNKDKNTYIKMDETVSPVVNQPHRILQALHSGIKG